MPTPYTDRISLILFPIFAGLVLLTLLPIGIVWGVNSLLFDFVAALHCVLLAASVLFHLRFLICLGQQSSGVVRAAFCIAVCGLLVMVLVGFLPVTSRDALIHHLAVPRWWVEAGFIHVVPWHEWSFYPMLINLAYTAFERWHIVSYTSLYHLQYLVISAGTVALTYRELTKDGRGAQIAAILLLTTPLCMRIGSEPLVDCGLLCYVSLSLCGMLLGTERSAPRWLLVAGGVSLGLALGCKYNGLVAFGAALCALVFVQRERPLHVGLKNICVVAVPALIVFFPWSLKNYIWSGNPLYPLYSALFPDPPFALPDSAPSLNAFETRIRLYGESLWQIVLLPLRVLYEGRDGNARLFDGVLSPIFLLCLVSLRRFRSISWVRFSLVFTAVYFLICIATSPLRARYLVPILPAFAILSTYGVLLFEQRFVQDALKKNLLPLILIAQCGLFLIYGANLWQKKGVWRYFTTEQTTAQYLAENISEYPMIEYINSNVPPRSRIYLLFSGNRHYYYNVKTFSAGHYSERWFLSWIRRSTTPAQLHRKLRESGISYLLLNTRLMRTFLLSLEPEKLALWTDFAQLHLVPLQERRGYLLLEVREQK